MSWTVQSLFGEALLIVGVFNFANLVNSSIHVMTYMMIYTRFLPLRGFPVRVLRKSCPQWHLPGDAAGPLWEPAAFLMFWGEERWYKARGVGQHWWWWWCRAPTSAILGIRFFLTATNSIEERVPALEPYQSVNLAHGRIIDLLAIILPYQSVFIIVNSLTITNHYELPRDTDQKETRTCRSCSIWHCRWGMWSMSKASAGLLEISGESDNVFIVRHS